MRIADLSQIDRSTAIYHIAFTVLNGVFNYTALYCLNYHIFFFHRLIVPLENFLKIFAETLPKPHLPFGIEAKGEESRPLGA